MKKHANEIKIKMREKIKEKVMKTISERMESYDELDNGCLGYVLPFKSDSGELGWAFYSLKINPFDPPKKAAVVYPKGVDFHPVVESVKKGFDDELQELKNLIKDVTRGVDWDELKKDLDDSYWSDVLKGAKDEEGAGIGCGGIIGGTISTGMYALLGAPAIFFAFPVSFIGLGVFAAARCAYRSKRKHDIRKILTSSDDIKKSWETVLEPVHLDEVDRIRSVVIDGEGWDPWNSEISAMGYHACKALLSADIGMDKKCEESYKEIVGQYEKYIGVLIPKGKISILGKPDVVGMYKNDPDLFKGYFRYQMRDRGEDAALRILKEIAGIDERNPDVDRWLTEKYPELSKKVARSVVKKV